MNRLKSYFSGWSFAFENLFSFRTGFRFITDSGIAPWAAVILQIAVTALAFGFAVTGQGPGKHSPRVNQNRQFQIPKHRTN